jgi:hypothetical protein
VCREPDRCDVFFDLDKVVFQETCDDLQMDVHVSVSPEDDVEVRRLTITNRGSGRAASK